MYEPNFITEGFNYNPGMAAQCQKRNCRCLCTFMLVFISFAIFSVKPGPETVGNIYQVILRICSRQPQSDDKAHNDVVYYKKETKDTKDPFHGHVQLKWLRQIITDMFGLKLSSDPYNFTSLYIFKTHIYLDYPLFHRPLYFPDTPSKILYEEGQKILKQIRYEALLTGYKRKYLPQIKDADAFGRTCDYDPHMEYDYRFSAYVTGNKVLVYVTETPKNKTKIGSSMSNYVFGVVNTPNTRSACNTTDYFGNHTYRIVCPIRGNDFKISIDATYLSLGDFAFVCKKNFVWNLKSYAEKHLKASNNLKIDEKGIDKAMIVMCKNSSGHEHGFWFKIGKIFHWGTRECHYPYYVTKPQVQCLRKKSIIMFGDSHTQDRVSAVKVVYDLPKLIHYKTRHSIHLLDTLLDVYELYMKGQRPADVLVVNAGNHDLRFLDVVTYIATMSDIFQIFKFLPKLKKPPKVIWVETTPVHFNGFHGRFMTRQVTEAMNDWINYNMRLLGVEIVHSFEIAQTMTSKHRGCGFHYYHFLGKRANSGKKVNIGGAVVSVVLHTICPVDCY